MSTMMSEGVGKRIVDALKMQSELEIVDKTQTGLDGNVVSDGAVSENVNTNETAENVSAENEYSDNSVNASQPIQLNYNAQGPMSSLNFGTHPNMSAEFANLEIPQNVAILKQLIAQLPSGVSRQAGALVIKQTMEALGISMKSVLQEAQQLQESLNLSARECQNSILECKKQINNLELQVQHYQKQSGSLNEIISLFVQVN